MLLLPCGVFPTCNAAHDALAVLAAGLDARAAAIVMRSVRNIVSTGRTIVCAPPRLVFRPRRILSQSLPALESFVSTGCTIGCEPSRWYSDRLGHSSEFASSGGLCNFGVSAMSHVRTVPR